jgi:hypothetical protein
MAMNGTGLDTIMTISGHTQLKSLLAYIGHGSKAAARIAEMARATEALSGTTTGEFPSPAN